MGEKPVDRPPAKPSHSLLPIEAIVMLQDAAQTPGIGIARQITIDMAIMKVREKWPQYFQIDKKT